ncbi:MAG: anti-sigma factor domain-containing protein [Jatrophihabitans sp.]|uniref:anti-sigma factor domain-containing protein n=1 Tax=Jatrophihabitans sp. TaxID=1932789 RepID=UPI003F823EE2
MTQHLADDLPRLLTGDAGRDEVMAAAEHLRACDDCREELVSAVVAHASLTSAQRFAPEIMAAVGADGDTPLPPLPDMSAVFATVRAEADATPEPVVLGLRRRTAYAVGAVAAAAVVATGITVVATNDSSSTSTTDARSVALAAYQQGPRSARATVKFAPDSRMTIMAAGLPSLDSQHRYEVWLTNAQRTAMKPVGWLDEDGTSTLTVPASLVSTYTDIEVSVQQVDAPNYEYSGRSVLRGAYS